MFIDEPGVVKWGHEERRFKRAAAPFNILRETIWLGDGCDTYISLRMHFVSG